MHGIILAIHFLSFLLCLLCAFLLIVEKMYEELKSEMESKRPMEQEGSLLDFL